MLAKLVTLSKLSKLVNSQLLFSQLCPQRMPIVIIVKIDKIGKISEIGKIGKIGNIGNIVKIVKIGKLTTFVFSTSSSEDAKRIYLPKFITVSQSVCQSVKCLVSLLVGWLVTRFLENCSKDDSETQHSDSSPICEQSDRAGFSKKNPNFFL